MMKRRGTGRHPKRQAGFSLIELLVTMVIMVEILIGLLILFDGSSKLARAQTHLSEMQQSLRVGQTEIVRFTRMAGAGGLPVTLLNLDRDGDGNPDPAIDYTTVGTFPSGLGVGVFNNVAEGSIIEVVDSNATESSNDEVVPGSDVLLVRGVLTTPLFYFDPPIDIGSWLDDNQLNNEEITLRSTVRLETNPDDNYDQDLATLSQRLESARAANRAEALILRDLTNPNAYAVLAFDHQNTSANDLTLAKCTDTGLPAGDPRIPDCLSLKVRLMANQSPDQEYAQLTRGTVLIAGAGMTFSPTGNPADDVELPSKFGSIGILEEYRFFVRTEWEIPGDANSRLRPVLSRTRFLPGSSIEVDRVDLAGDVLDLQVAVGIDTDRPGSGDEYGRITDDGTGGDEVLFNSTQDTPGGNLVDPPGDATVWFDPALEFHFLRINTIARTPRADREHLSPLLTQIEDYDRGADFQIGGKTYNWNTRSERTFRRRWLQTVVELRNLS